MGLQHNLAAHLLEIRTARKLSLSEFSAELGIARSSLQSILRGASNPRMDTVEVIAQSLGVAPIALLSEPNNCPADTMAQQITSLSQSQRLRLVACLTEITELLQEDGEQTE